MIVHQLQQVPVAGDDLHVIALRRHLFRRGTEHVIRLKPFYLQTGDAERIYQLLHAADLETQVIRHFGPGAFVGREQVIAEGLPDIEGDCQVIRMIVFQQPQQDRGKPVGSGGRLSLRCGPA